MQTKQVGHLRDLLKSHRIRTEESLRRLIEDMSQLDSGEVSFKVIRDRDLLLDSESRSYEKRFVYSRTIFDCAEINIHNSEWVELKDCVILGSLRVSNKTEGKISACIDTTLVTGRFQIDGLGTEFESISLTDVCTPDLRIDYLRFTEMHMSGVICQSAVLYRLKGDELNTFRNHFRALRVSDSTFERVFFPSGQVELGSWATCKWLSRSPGRRRFNPFALEPVSLTEKEWDSLSKSDNTRKEIDTLEFLSSRTDTPNNKSDAATLKYLRALAESHGSLSRGFVLITGAFTKPSRIVLLSVAVILIFASLYWFSRSNFAGCGIKTILDALYFSGITFTTIGYGDISPSGAARLLSVCEGLLGIVLSSSFVVSIVRRYIE
jgi:hypothetical protein